MNLRVQNLRNGKTRRLLFNFVFFIKVHFISNKVKCDKFSFWNTINTNV